MTPDARDVKLIAMAQLLGLQFIGYRRWGRGYRVEFWVGTVGDLRIRHVARHKLADWILTETKKIAR